MARPGLEHLSELLEGYCEPDEKRYAVNGNALGHTGLTSRVRAIVYLDALIRVMARPREYDRRSQQFFATYHPILQMARSSWLTEFLRVMDKASTGADRNLTVGLFHERFRAEPTIPAADRATEAGLFAALAGAYDAAGLRRFRNKAWFHLDLVHNLQGRTGGGGAADDLHDLTDRLLEWYRCVATLVFEGEPRYVTEGAAQEARRFLREFRHMMVSARIARRAAHARRVAAGRAGAERRPANGSAG